MGSAYYDWDTNWTDLYGPAALADEADVLTDAISLDGKATCQISVIAVEDNTGACDGNLYIYCCRETNGTGFEDFTADDDNDSPALIGVIDPVQAKTRRRVCTIDASEASDFKIALDNDSGQELTVTVRVRYATIATA